MTLRTDHTYRCDRCGADVGNAGVQVCAIVTRLSPETGAVEQLHLCPDCTGKVFTKRALADYLNTEGLPR